MSNKFASTVARSIAKRPGATAFNPLFLYGGYGVGKTHLGQAVGLEVKSQFPDKVVLYLSSEKFIQQFISAAKAHKQTEFANFYQMVDVLIIDDIQFLSGKSATQDSFFHIFDYLHQNGKQIILTSDKAPVDIMDIQDRIVSRSNGDFLQRSNLRIWIPVKELSLINSAETELFLQKICWISLLQKQKPT